MLLSEAFERYRLDVIAFRGQSSSTEEHYQISTKHLIRFVGDIELETLSFDDVRKWKQTMEREHKAIQTIRGNLIKIRITLAYMRKNGYSCLDPDLIPLPKKVDKVPTFITKEQVTHLIEACDHTPYPMMKLRNKAIIALLYASGVRVSELCSLDISDIHNQSFTIVGKGGKSRLCFIDDRATAYIHEYLQLRKNGYMTYRHQRQTTKLYKNRTHQPDSHVALLLGKYKNRLTPCDVQLLFRTLSKQLHTDKPITAHVLRHTFATELLRANCNMRYVQTFLGHASLQTTQMYTHVVDEDLRKIYLEKHEI